MKIPDEENKKPEVIYNGKKVGTENGVLIVGDGELIVVGEGLRVVTNFLRLFASIAEDCPPIIKTIMVSAITEMAKDFKGKDDTANNTPDGVLKLLLNNINKN